MEKCHGILGFILGHKFEPRYLTDGMDIEKTIEGDTALLKSIQDLTYSSDKVPLMRKYLEERKHLTKREYLNDVCVRCGRLTNRHPETGNERLLQL